MADDHIASPYEDRDAARELGNRSDVVTYEFENVDAAAADAAGGLAPVYPSSPRTAHCAGQNPRKSLAQRSGIPRDAVQAGREAPKNFRLQSGPSDCRPFSRRRVWGTTGRDRR